MARIRVTLNCPADQYAAKHKERIIEVMDPDTGKGGLIAFIRMDDGTLLISPYQLDEDVTVLLPKPEARYVAEEVQGKKGNTMRVNTQLRSVPGGYIARTYMGDCWAWRLFDSTRQPLPMTTRTAKEAMARLAPFAPLDDAPNPEGTTHD